MNRAMGHSPNGRDAKQARGDSPSGPVPHERDAPYYGPSLSFISRGRNPELESPTKFIPTIKAEGDVIL